MFSDGAFGDSGELSESREGENGERREFGDQLSGSASGGMWRGGESGKFVSKSEFAYIFKGHCDFG